MPLSLPHPALAVSPLTTARAIPADYLTLDEALETGKVLITELSQSGSVPELQLRNETEWPVLLLDGEELLGAKQNRICNLTVLAPAKAETVIPVSCVEAGRWHLRSPAFSASKNIQFAIGRARKASRVSMSLAAYGVPHGRQEEVWRDIANKLDRRGAHSQTAAMSDAFAWAEDSVLPFVQSLTLPADSVGAVFSLNGQPLGLELFETPAVCARLSEKLIRSWALDAIEHEHRTNSPAPRDEAITRFLAAVAAAPAERFPSAGIGESVRLSGDEFAGGALVLGERVLHATAYSSGFVTAH